MQSSGTSAFLCAVNLELWRPDPWLRLISDPASQPVYFPPFPRISPLWYSLNNKVDTLRVSM